MEVQLSNYQVLELIFGIKLNFASSLQNTFHSNENSLFTILTVGMAKLSLLPLRARSAKTTFMEDSFPVPLPSLNTDFTGNQEIIQSIIIP